MPDRGASIKRPTQATKYIRILNMQLPGGHLPDEIQKHIVRINSSVLPKHIGILMSSMKSNMVCTPAPGSSGPCLKSLPRRTCGANSGATNLTPHVLLITCCHQTKKRLSDDTIKSILHFTTHISNIDLIDNFTNCCFIVFGSIFPTASSWPLPIDPSTHGPTFPAGAPSKVLRFRLGNNTPRSSCRAHHCTPFSPIKKKYSNRFCVADHYPRTHPPKRSIFV